MKPLVPDRGLEKFRREVDRLFDRAWEGEWMFPAARVEPWIPELDLVEKGDELIARVDVPGMEAKDIHVLVRDDLLTIRGEKYAEYDAKDEKRHRSERAYGAFTRTVPLPFPVNGSKVAAQVKAGVLTVTMQKVAQASLKEVPVLAG